MEIQFNIKESLDTVLKNIGNVPNSTKLKLDDWLYKIKALPNSRDNFRNENIDVTIMDIDTIELYATRTHSTYILHDVRGTTIVTFIGEYSKFMEQNLIPTMTVIGDIVKAKVMYENVAMSLERYISIRNIEIRARKNWDKEYMPESHPSIVYAEMVTPNEV